MAMEKRLELLSPAGDWERLEMALAYGADAVYLAGDTFGMRAFAGNFSQEDLPRVFDRGFTGCNGRLEQRSSGIGLYLCRRILNQLGHSIEIQSTPGKGTQVRLHLEQNPLAVE